MSNSSPTRNIGVFLPYWLHKSNLLYLLHRYFPAKEQILLTIPLSEQELLKHGYKSYSGAEISNMDKAYVINLFLY